MLLFKFRKNGRMEGGRVVISLFAETQLEKCSAKCIEFKSKNTNPWQILKLFIEGLC